MLLEGIDGTITKTATIVPEFLEEAVHIFKPLQFQTQAVMKIACEPLNPSELPKMVPPPPLARFTSAAAYRCHAAGTMLGGRVQRPATDLHGGKH